ncbi:hypothetical protein EGT74_09645 [Chitinophaga lutea]|uniref:Transposase IS200-like domain-containing protein n=2 Tax=Chitinophaga lutea TaxID=2488634 RepID=A0A3N4QQ53_9BACT|nr:hypothetical protein EGT74_09645 [Chitinophaga lutea]
MLDSLTFMVQENRIWLYGFVVLPNEFHLLWRKQPAWELKNIRQMLLKFTAQQIKHRLKAVNRRELETYRTPKADRQFQFWERKSEVLVIASLTEAQEKLNIMHQMPVIAGCCERAEDYRFSSAAFYRKDPINETAPKATIQQAQGAEGPDVPALTHYNQHLPP